LDAGIIRNKLKVRSAVSNAIAFMEPGRIWQFSKYIWHLQMETYNQQPKTLKKFLPLPTF
jgi:DNA-3-methyladenine glycosylase I